MSIHTKFSKLRGIYSRYCNNSALLSAIIKFNNEDENNGEKINREQENNIRKSIERDEKLLNNYLKDIE